MAIDTGRSSAGWSSYGAWRKCPRKWAYENVYSLGTSGGGARGLGTLIHELLARHYLVKAGDTSQPSIESILGTVGNGMKADAVDLARSRILSYALQYSAEDWTPIAVEQEHRIGFLPQEDGSVLLVDADTPGSVLYTARIDLVVKDGDGRVWCVDHKTASQIRESTHTRYGLHGQFHGLWHIGRHHYGEAFAGTLINFVQTWAGERFLRVRPPAAPSMIANFPKLIYATASEMQLWKGIAKVPEDWPATSHETVCVSSYGVCDHATRCRFG